MAQHTVAISKIVACALTALSDYKTNKTVTADGTELDAFKLFRCIA